MTAPRWLDRPPTAAEVRRHAEAHPCGQPNGMVVARWMRVDADGQPQIVRVGISPRSQYPNCIERSMTGAQRWLHLTAEGLPDREAEPANTRNPGPIWEELRHAAARFRATLRVDDRSGAGRAMEIDPGDRAIGSSLSLACQEAGKISLLR